MRSKIGLLRKDPKYMKTYFRFLKHWAVEKLGRRCQKCNLISEFDCIYDFHHNGEEGNSWSTGTYRLNTASTQRVKKLAKWQRENKIPEDVVLLCANCHRIIEFSND